MSNSVYYLGMYRTWYLQSHFVWLKLSYSSIAEFPHRVLGGSRLEISSKVRNQLIWSRSRGIIEDMH